MIPVMPAFYSRFYRPFNLFRPAMKRCQRRFILCCHCALTRRLPQAARVAPIPPFNSTALSRRRPPSPPRRQCPYIRTPQQRPPGPRKHAIYFRREATASSTAPIFWPFATIFSATRCLRASRRRRDAKIIRRCQFTQPGPRRLMPPASATYRYLPVSAITSSRRPECPVVARAAADELRHLMKALSMIMLKMPGHHSEGLN